MKFIDVNADDQRSDVELTRNITEETDPMMAAKKKTDQPSSQQKRKHQITYLAFKVKVAADNRGGGGGGGGAFSFYWSLERPVYVILVCSTNCNDLLWFENQCSKI